MSLMLLLYATETQRQVAGHQPENLYQVSFGVVLVIVSAAIVTLRPLLNATASLLVHHV